MGKIKCEYCDSVFSDTMTACPNCGAPNQNARRGADIAPTTIQELLSWYHNHNLPSQYVSHFFIGEKIKYPNITGIYR